MAPKKEGKEEKETKLNADQSAALILDYLRKQNRPYSATDISSNLRNRVTKTAAAKLLKDMHERKDIEGRAAGKQIVYHAIQDEADEVSSEDLEAMATNTTRLKEQTTALKAEEKELRVRLRDDAAQIPLPQLQAAVSALELEKASVEQRLARLQEESLVPVNTEERERAQAEYRRWSKVAGERKKIRKLMWETIADALEKQQADELMEKLGIEL